MVSYLGAPGIGGQNAVVFPESCIQLFLGLSFIFSVFNLFFVFEFVLFC